MPDTPLTNPYFCVIMTCVPEGLEAYFQNQKEFIMNKKSIFVTFKRLFIILGGGYLRNPSFMREFS